MPLERLALSRSTLDRSAVQRSDPQLIDRLLTDERTLVALFHSDDESGDTAAVAPGPTVRLWSATDPVVRRAASTSRLTLFLGADAQGRAHLAISVPERPALPEGCEWASLRQVGAVIDDTGAGIFTTAVALVSWHRFHTHCANCGAGTDVVQAGWVRLCPACGREHFPRTDPAVIMTVIDPDGRLLLGRHANWPEHRYSTLAGFVEPGEPLEDAVRREVAEEAGVRVGAVHYRGSQPWPFPSSLMLGFQGEALSSEITVDTVEIADARWWSREELQTDVRTGNLVLPPVVSIARRLIEDWFGGPIPDAPPSW